MTRTPPQPAAARITPFAGRPLVVGAEPDPPDPLPPTVVDRKDTASTWDR